MWIQLQAVPWQLSEKMCPWFFTALFWNSVHFLAWGSQPFTTLAATFKKKKLEYSFAAWLKSLGHLLGSAAWRTCLEWCGSGTRHDDAVLIVSKHVVLCIHIWGFNPWFLQAEKAFNGLKQYGYLYAKVTCPTTQTSFSFLNRSGLIIIIIMFFPLFNHHDVW